MIISKWTQKSVFILEKNINLKVGEKGVKKGKSKERIIYNQSKKRNKTS